MKNLFNNISQEEKNRILEMHSGKKRVIYEQDDNWMTPEQQKMAKYAITQWEEGKPGSIESEGNSMTLSINSKNLSTLTFDGLKNIIIYDKKMAIDPKPISLNVTFNEFKKWFDSNNNYNPLSGVMPQSTYGGLKTRNSRGGVDGL
jgi:hypothetical protein